MTGFITEQNVIFVDDDAALRAANVQSLELAGLTVRAFADATSALAEIEAGFTGAIISDIRMPRIDGLEFFSRIKAIDPDIPIILITGHADVAMAIGALKGGAFDFLTKPFAPDHLIASTRRALETRRLVLDNRMLRAITDDSDSPLVGDSPIMVRLRETILQVATADIDVLVEGETGTGKELGARLLHRKGPRMGKPFIAVNCGAMPEALAEVELFGHDRGATGHGPSQRDGRIVQADHGTLFLDEIDSMPLSIQAKMLRVLEEREVMPIGGVEPRVVNLRVVAAAKCDLGELVRTGKFREDLFYRLNVVRLRMPPLRETRADIPQLFAGFVAEAADKIGSPAYVLTDAVRRHLMLHDWPGNVRELRNFAYKVVTGLGVEAAGTINDETYMPLPERIADFEGQIIRAALAETRGNIAQALKILGIPRKTLYDKLARHGLEARQFR